MIEIRFRAKRGIRDIARDLHRNHGVISREIRRNQDKGSSYSALKAQKKADARMRRNRDRLCKLDEDLVLRAHVISELKKGMKPHVISGRLKTHPPPGFEEKHVSHETIFQWIYVGTGRYEDLYQYLQFNQRKRKKQRMGRRASINIPDRISIHDRPPGIDERKDYGHWESDSMVFQRGQKARLSVQYERKSKYLLIHRLSDGTAEETERALEDSILSLPGNLWKSITFDNGKEGMNHGNLRKKYGLQTYFCDPYASYQKGGVERGNGMIRRILPRQTDMSELTQKDIYAIQEKINNTPRRSLDYLTPKEVLEKICGQGVVH